MAHKFDQNHNNNNELDTKEIDVLCESVAHMDLRFGTNDPSRPSDNHNVNDMSGNKALMNCYLTALVGNSRNYNRLGTKMFAMDFNISVTNAKNLQEINDLCTGLGEEEGYRQMQGFKDKSAFLQFLNNELEKNVAKKYIFLHYLSPDDTRQLYQEFDVLIAGHVLSLKTRKANNGRWMYLFIDYQRSKDDRERVRNKLPRNAFPPFYIFEKRKY